MTSQTLRRLGLAALIFAVTLPAAAHPRGGHWRGAVVVDLTPWPWYPYPYYVRSYDPVPVLVEPVVMPNVEAPQASWYYCEAAAAYYPYVSTCPAGWKTVPAQPAGAPEPAKAPAPQEKK